MKLIIVDLFYGVYNSFSTQEIDFVSKSANDDIIIFYMLGEKWPPTQVNNILKKFFNDTISKKNIIFIGDKLNTDKELEQVIIKNKVKFDSQLIKVAHYEEERGFNRIVNLDTGRFLFLMGKPYKTNRLPFLYELYQHNLLSQCDYSFYYDKNYEIKTRDVMSFLDKADYNSFIRDTVKSLDHISHDIGDDYFNYSGLPVDSNLYRNSSFSVIAETEADSEQFYFISEKTWRTIASRHMFLSLSHKNNKDYLNNLGISTFDYCLKYTKYDYNNTDQYLLNKLTAENVKYLLENIHRHTDRIKEDIENNYHTFKKLIDYQRQYICKFIEKRLYPSDIYDNELPYQQIQVTEIDNNLNIQIKQMIKILKFTDIGI